MSTGNQQGSTPSGELSVVNAVHGETRLGEPGAWLEWLMLVGYAAATAIAIGCALGIVVALTASAAMAAPADTAAETTQVLGRAVGGRLLPASLADLPRVEDISQTAGAGLLLNTTQGMVIAPVQATTANMKVTGTTVRGTVTQRFTNPSEDWLEGIFVFPLPSDGAVDHVRMRVGDREIEGRIQDRESARQKYERAKARGQQSSLVEQQRPNLFTTRVANIAPWATVEVSIEYQQTLALRDGVWRLRFPAVVAPRNAHDGTESAAPAAAIRLPGEKPAPAMALSVDIDAGVPVSRPVSGTHQILVIADQPTAALKGSVAHLERQEPGSDAHRFQVQLKPGGAMPDRDFELEWQPLPGHAPAAMLPLEKHGAYWYGMLMLTPPTSLATPEVRQPRELTFVVDTSGSMSGASIEQARSALLFGLDRLQAGDRFNLIRFGATHESLFRTPREFNQSSRREARAWIEALRAEGGTEMHGALEQALAAPGEAGFVKQVVFLTDGAIDHEDAMLRLIDRAIGDRRLFTVGIGSAPNSWFMRKAAEIGRGTFTHIGRVEEVERRMAELFAKLARPLVTRLSVSFDGASPIDPLPPLPDLYAGEPLIVRARFDKAPSGATVAGRLGSTEWEGRANAHETAETGLHVLWARARIEALNDAIRFGGGSIAALDSLREEISALGLEHHLVTQYTSLVAVDVTPVRAGDAPLRSGKGPGMLAAGWEHFAAVGSGELARGASRAGREIGVGLMMLLAGLALLKLTSGRRSRPMPTRPLSPTYH